MCPVVVTNGASADLVTYVKGFPTEVKRTMTWSRFLFPVLVDLESGTVVCPEGLPPRMSFGGMAARTLLKQARNTAEKNLVPGAGPSYRR